MLVRTKTYFMVKKLLAFILFLGLTGFTFSQKRDADSPFRFGLNVNPLLTWNNPGQNFSPNGVKAGFEYGLNIHYYFFKNVGVETGLYMNHHGAKFTYSNSRLINNGTDTAHYAYNMNLNNIYVKIPIGLRFRTNQIGPVYLFGNFGVDFSFAISSKLKFSGRDLNVHTTNDSTISYSETNNKISPAPVRIGLFVGGGVEYPISGSFSITAQLNYNYGFLNVVRDDFSSKNKQFAPQSGIQTFPYSTPDKEDTRTQYLGLSLGVLF